MCYVNAESADRIIYSIFQRFNLEWKTRTLSVFRHSLTVTHRAAGLTLFHRADIIFLRGGAVW